jgi:hypothetical protein
MGDKWNIERLCMLECCSCQGISDNQMYETYARQLASEMCCITDVRYPIYWEFLTSLSCLDQSEMAAL